MYIYTGHMRVFDCRYCGWTFMTLDGFNENCQARQDSYKDPSLILNLDSDINMFEHSVCFHTERIDNGRSSQTLD